MLQLPGYAAAYGTLVAVGSPGTPFARDAAQRNRSRRFGAAYAKILVLVLDRCTIVWFNPAAGDSLRQRKRTMKNWKNEPRDWQGESMTRPGTIAIAMMQNEAYLTQAAISLKAGFMTTAQYDAIAEVFNSNAELLIEELRTFNSKKTNQQH
jgi:hypothetical protein